VALGGSASRRFAEALLDLAVEGGAVAALRESLDRLRTSFDAPTIRSLRDPGTRLERRLAAVDKAAAGEPRQIRSLLRVLVERDRIALLPAIAQSFGEIVDKREGIAVARVTTAVLLPKEQQDALVRRLEQASGRKVRASFLVDAGLLGGAKVQVGDRLVDSSIRSQLESLRAKLAS